MTKGQGAWFRCGFIMLVGIFCLLGWLGVKPTLANDQETVLLDSGFKKWSADSTKKQSFFQTVPSNKIVTYKRKDKTAHAAYSTKTKALYVGDDNAYQKYLQNAKTKGIIPKERQDADNLNDPQFWSLWEASQGGG